MPRPIAFTNIKTTTPAEEIIQQATTIFASSRGYSIKVASDQMVTAGRRYIPTWAIVTAIATAFFFLLGLLFLLKKDEDSITVTTKPDRTPGVTVVNILGSGSNAVVEALGGLVAGLEIADPPAPPPSSE